MGFLDSLVNTFTNFPNPFDFATPSSSKQDGVVGYEIKVENADLSNVKKNFLISPTDIISMNLNCSPDYQNQFGMTPNLSRVATFLSGLSNASGVASSLDLSTITTLLKQYTRTPWVMLPATSPAIVKVTEAGVKSTAKTWGDISTQGSYNHLQSGQWLFYNSNTFNVDPTNTNVSLRSVKYQDIFNVFQTLILQPAYAQYVPLDPTNNYFEIEVRMEFLSGNGSIASGRLIDLFIGGDGGKKFGFKRSAVMNDNNSCYIGLKPDSSDQDYERVASFIIGLKRGNVTFPFDFRAITNNIGTSETAGDDIDNSAGYSDLVASLYVGIKCLGFFNTGFFVKKELPMQSLNNRFNGQTSFGEINWNTYAGGTDSAYPGENFLCANSSTPVVSVSGTCGTYAISEYTQSLVTLQAIARDYYDHIIAMSTQIDSSMLSLKNLISKLKSNTNLAKNYPNLATNILPKFELTLKSLKPKLTDIASNLPAEILNLTAIKTGVLDEAGKEAICSRYRTTQMILDTEAKINVINNDIQSGFEEISKELTITGYVSDDFNVKTLVDTITSKLTTVANSVSLAKDSGAALAGSSIDDDENVNGDGSFFDTALLEASKAGGIIPGVDDWVSYVIFAVIGVIVIVGVSLGVYYGIKKKQSQVQPVTK
jgi:hypothetical protein